MKIKVGDKIYDGNKERVMIIVSPGERKQIMDMAPGATRYCQYPSGEYSREEIEHWMKEGAEAKHEAD